MRLELQNVTKTYQEGERSLTVLDRVSHTFPESGSVAILGRSGVGKSTFLHLLGGLDRATEGQIFFDQTDISRLDDEQLSHFRGKNVGFVFQFHHLLPDFTALENVAMPALISGESEVMAQERAKEMLASVGLEQRIEHVPGQLSGGEQQRVAIARALVGEPRVILADEPTGNLDEETAADIRGLLFAMNSRLKNLLIIVTHSQDLAAHMDSVLHMGPGGRLEQV